MKIIVCFFFLCIQYPILFMGETTISQDKKEKLYEAFEWMEKFLEGQNWFAGDTMTIADLSILASLSSILVRKKEIKRNEMI